MRTRLSSKIIGSGADADLVRKILTDLDEALQFYDSPDLKWQMTPRGITARVNFPPPGTFTQQETFYPFKIYQPTGLGELVGTTQGLVVAYATGANLVSCLIVDADTDTDLTANPPKISIGETWRFWAVRSGYIEIRPNYSIAPTISSGGNGSMMVVPKYTDFYSIFPYWTLLNFPDEQPFDPFASNTVVVLGGTPDDNGILTAGLWIQAAQDTSNANLPTATICGYVAATTVSNFDPPFYNLNNGVVPVGIIGIGQNDSESGETDTAINFIFDHARNRYPCGNGNWPSGAGNGTVRNFRGTVSYNATADAAVVSPTDLQSQVIYPGDEIWFYNYFTAGAGGTNYNGPYIFVGPTAAFFSQVPVYPNPIGDSNWKLASAIAVQPL